MKCFKSPSSPFALSSSKLPYPRLGVFSAIETTLEKARVRRGTIEVTRRSCLIKQADKERRLPMIATRLIVTLGIRSAVSSGKKVPKLLLTLAIAISAVLLVGGGVQALPQRTPLSAILVGGAWCFGAPLGLRIAARISLARLNKKSPQHKNS